MLTLTDPVLWHVCGTRLSPPLSRHSHTPGHAGSRGHGSLEGVEIAALVISIIVAAISALNFYYTRYEFRRAQVQSLNLFEQSGSLIDVYFTWGSFHSFDQDRVIVFQQNRKQHYNANLNPNAPIREPIRKAPLIGAFVQNSGRGSISVREVQLIRKFLWQTASTGELLWQVDDESPRFLVGKTFPARLEGKQSEVFLMSLLEPVPELILWQQLIL